MLPSGKMTKKGEILKQAQAYAHYLIGNGVAREYRETPATEFKTKPEVLEPSWSELRKEAKEKGVFKVGMKKDEVKKALDDLRK